MGVKHVKKKDGFPKMIKELKAVDGAGVQAGVLGGENAWLASIHEYGCDIKVTPKMRAWLHYQGIHLKKETAVVHIPARSFIRNGYDQNKDGVLRKSSLLLSEVAAGRMTKRVLMQAVGLLLSTKIKEYAVELDDPPNSSFTVDRKGSSNPLVDSGDMVEGITWRMKK